MKWNIVLFFSFVLDLFLVILCSVCRSDEIIHFSLRKWQKVTSHFLGAGCSASVAKNHLSSPHAVTPRSSAANCAAGGRRRLKENRSNRSGAVSDPRINPGGVSVCQPIGGPDGTCRCLLGFGTRVPGYILGDGGGARTPLSMHHACCRRLTLVVVTQHRQEQSEIMHMCVQTFQKNQKAQTWRENKSRPMMTSNRLL